MVGLTLFSAWRWPLTTGVCLLLVEWDDDSKGAQRRWLLKVEKIKGGRIHVSGLFLPRWGRRDTHQRLQ